MSAGKVIRLGVARARRARRRARLGRPPLPAPPYTHRGLELEIRFDRAGAILSTDSDRLYWAALRGDRANLCNVGCRPGCRRHGWLELLGEPGAGLDDGDRLRVRVRPVLLADELDERESL